MTKPKINISNNGFYLCRGSDVTTLPIHKMSEKATRKNQGGFIPLLIIGALAVAVLILWLLGGGGSGCPEAAQYYKFQIDNCWSCDLYETIFNAINDVATKAYNGLHKGCLGLLGVFLALWLLFFTGRYLFSFAQRKPEEYLSKLLGMLFKATIVAALLSTSASTFGYYIVSPVITTAAEYGIAVMEGFYSVKDTAIRTEGNVDNSNSLVKCENGTCTYRDVSCGMDCDFDIWSFSFSCDYGCDFEGYKDLRPDSCQRMKAGNYEDKNDKLITDEVKDSFMCMMNSMHYETAYVTAMGNAMLCHSWTAYDLAGLFRFPSVKMLVTSLCILLAVLIITFVYVFKLIDVVLRLGILLILTPVLAVAFVFPVTLEFAKKGFSLLIHIALTFVALILVLSLSLMLVTLAFSGTGDGATLMDAFNSNDMNEIKDLIDFSSLNFLFGLITLLIAIKILGISEHIATEFSQVKVGTSIGDRLGATFASVSFITGQMGLRSAKLFSAEGFNAWRERKAQKKMDAIRNHQPYGRKAVKAAKYEEKAQKKGAKAVAAIDKAEDKKVRAEEASRKYDDAKVKFSEAEKNSKAANERVKDAQKSSDLANENLKKTQERYKDVGTVAENQKKYSDAEEKYRAARQKYDSEGGTEESRKAVNESYREFKQAEDNLNKAREVANAQERADNAKAKLDAAKEEQRKAAEAESIARNNLLNAKTEADLARADADKAASKAEGLADKAEAAGEKAATARYEARTFTEKLADRREEKAAIAAAKMEESDKRSDAAIEEKHRVEERFAKQDAYVADRVEQAKEEVDSAQKSADWARDDLEKAQERYGDVGTVSENQNAYAEAAKAYNDAMSSGDRERINTEHKKFEQARKDLDNARELEAAQIRAAETERALQEAAERKAKVDETAARYEKEKQRAKEEARENAEAEVERYRKLKGKYEKKQEKAEETRRKADFFAGKSGSDY